MTGMRDDCTKLLLRDQERVIHARLRTFDAAGNDVRYHTLDSERRSTETYRRDGKPASRSHLSERSSDGHLQQSVAHSFSTVSLEERKVEEQVEL